MAKCNNCGETNWLLEKKEQRFYYAVIKPMDELRWIEETKSRKTTNILDIVVRCSKCEGNAKDIADMGYVITLKPFKVIWQTRFWDNFK